MVGLTPVVGIRHMASAHPAEAWVGIAAAGCQDLHRNSYPLGAGEVALEARRVEGRPLAPYAGVGVRPYATTAF